nr:WAT1-related protein At2g39510-like isoform X1 [Ipomoea batatas]
MTRENLVKFLKLVKPYLVVILLQFGYAGMGIITKSALNDGMSPFTYAAYRSFFAAAFLAPFAVAFERNIRPKMTVPIFLKIMTLALLEPVIDMNLHFIGMKYTTATLQHHCPMFFQPLLLYWLGSLGFLEPVLLSLVYTWYYGERNKIKTHKNHSTIR